MNPSPFETEPVKITILPPQFSLRALLVAAAGIGATFGVLRWFEVSAAVGFFVLAVFLVAALATGGVIAALLQSYTTVEPADRRRHAVSESGDPFERAGNSSS